MVKVAQTMEERLALIKEVSRKFQERKKREARFIREERITERASKKEKKEADNENWNHWTDSEAYANKYYGEVYRETTRYDNDWD